MAPTENTNKRGILLLALGHPQYGRMAANLASAIFHNDRDMPIHLVYSGNALSHLTPYHLALLAALPNAPKNTTPPTTSRITLRLKRICTSYRLLKKRCIWIAI